jgi:hypothetical protein
MLGGDNYDSNAVTVGSESVFEEVVGSRMSVLSARRAKPPFSDRGGTCVGG